MRKKWERKKERKIRKDIMICPSVWNMAQRKADEQDLSVSAYISRLIKKKDRKDEREEMGEDE